ncbi:protein-export chaperone SecB [Cellvibrio polysaccharolyticus]|uniref:Protein-export protein SecB n=1 Tax=Cellvibrio polysaccharolyticus TaxID=2082724 RepID=A0A928YX78_9GAMM|nr:protein-export chaperone SecB [Cellvibrio polysaccharolyticus]MBE8719068.1 protein-export chaperone SecB [Cellvibrio polysaccharolyticus]
MTEENNTVAAGEEQSQAAPNFAIQRVYLKDISFETPMGVEAFLQPAKPAIQQDLNIQVNQLNDDTMEVVLLLTITAKVEARTLFLVEVKQAGLFTIAGFDKRQVTQLINTACPQILFPYAREAIDSILNRGSFPPLMLAPINFDAVFVQAMEQARQQSDAAPAAEAPAAATIN